MPSSLPSRAAGDLGAALSNIRTPATNELSAVNVEKIKDWIIAIATELGLLDGSTSGSVWEAILASAGITQLTGDATAGPGSGSQAITVSQARGLRETSGPTTLAMGAIADGEVARRSGSNLVGFAPGFSFVSITGNTTLPAHDAIVNVNTTAVSAPGTMTLTLPAPAAGRVYLIRKVAGAVDETITLARAASESIDNQAASRLLPSSDQEVDPAAWYYAQLAWLVWSDGTNWFSTAFGRQVRNQISASAPVDTTHTATSEVGMYLPGSTWYESTNKRLYMACHVAALGNMTWHRIDALDPLSVVTTAVTLPSRDQAVFVDTATAGGNVSLTLPSPTGRNAGRQFVITRVNASGTNKITLVRAASENINGTGASYDLPGSATAAYGRWHVISDGTNWWVTGGSGL